MFLREFLRLGNPLNCGAWDKKLLKQYRVHKPSSLSYDTEPRSKSVLLNNTEIIVCYLAFFQTYG